MTQPNAGLPLAVSSWDGEEEAAIERVIRSGRYTMGSKVRAFENSFARFHGSSHACMVNSGSSANLIMFAAARFGPTPLIRPGQEVIVPAVSWSTTFYPVNQVGGVLRFVDVDPNTFNLDVDKVREAIGPQTGAILAVNLLGNPADLVALKGLADAAGVPLFEDNCESLGASIEDRLTGTFGTASSCSFFFSHHISTMEGGAIVTQDTGFYETCKSLRAHGWLRDLPADTALATMSGDPWEDLFRFVLPGYNVRPLEFEGAVGEIQLAKLPAFLQARRRNAAHFKSLFESMPGVRIQREHGSSSWFGFGLLLADHLSGRRREVVARLSRAGIETRPIVAGNFTRNPVMKHLNARTPESLPGADMLHEQGFFLGNHHFDVSAQLSRAADIVASIQA